MLDDAKTWRMVQRILHQELPRIDEALSQENVPVSARPRRACDIVVNRMPKVPDRSAFLLSEDHGKLLVVIRDWYCSRYGDIVTADKNADFVSMVLVHGTPFTMHVPRRFITSTGEPDTVWIGWPASVQVEEDPLGWIQNPDVVSRLSDQESDVVRQAALNTANLVRSIDFDLRLLADVEDVTVTELAGSVRTDFQSSASNLSRQNQAALRSAAWEASQATEKALKILYRQRTGEDDHPGIHRLGELAKKAGAEGIDRADLARIPSGQDATNLRYGGPMTLQKAVDSYNGALAVVRQVLLEATPEGEYNWRNARLKIQRPPWFQFDAREFGERLGST